MKLNIVLDLDSTLIWTFDDDEKEDFSEEDHANKLKKISLYSDPKKIELRKKIYRLDMLNSRGQATGEKDVMYGVRRPYLDEFLDYIGENCNHIIVWTAGIRRYGDELSNRIFKNHRKPDLILTRASLKETVDDEDGQIKECMKPLSDIYKIFVDMNETNTIVVDDKKSTFNDNPDNALHIDAFSCDLEEIDILNNGDDCLLKIIEWMETDEVKNCTDIRKINKDIFNVDI